MLWQARVGKASLDHAANINVAYLLRGQRSGLSDCRLEHRRVAIGLPIRNHCKIFKDELLKIMTNRDFAELASLLGKAKCPLAPVMAEILDSESRKGAGSGCGVNERSDNRPVAQADDQRNK